MGLLDFFQKGGSSDGQNAATTPAVPDFASIQQSYTNQSLANVTYPAPNANPYAPSNPVTPQSNITQQAQPNQTQPQAQPLQPKPVSEPADIMEAANTKPVENFEYTDPSKHPVLPAVEPNQGHTQTMPEGIKVTTYEPPVVTNQIVEQVKVEQPKIEQPQPEQVSKLPTPPVEEFNAIVATPIENVEQVQPTQAVEQINELPKVEEFTPLQEIQPSSEVVPELPQVSELPQLTEQVQKVTNTMSELPAETVLPPVDLPQDLPQSKPEVTELPTVAPVDTLKQEQPSTNEVSSIEFGVTEPVVGQVNELPQEEEMPPVNTPAEVSSPVELEAPLPASTVTEIDVVPEAPIAIVEKEVKVSEVEKAPQSVFDISFFKTVGFIGLNTQVNSKVADKLATLADKLADFTEAFVLDSAKGYAKAIFEKAKLKNTEVTGMLLKPFHSEYSDESDLSDYDGYTAMVFSSQSDKIKNLVKESDLLVMPESAGIVNLAVLFDIWSINSIYGGQGKPVILLGKDWNNIVDQLKVTFKLSDKDLRLINVCQGTTEALSKIAELDKALLQKEVKQPKRVIDLREEEDEEGLFVA
jgi:hypothetical protein